jgi:bifunctional non-homologous end joining protein LigD
LLLGHVVVHGGLTFALLFLPQQEQRCGASLHHDGFRFLAVRHGKQVRVYSRGGHDWSERLPSITEAMRTLPVRSVVLDGEGVICGPEGKSDFDRMRACFGRDGAPEAFLYACDLLELDGRDLRSESMGTPP